MKAFLLLFTAPLAIAARALAHGSNDGHMAAGDRMMSYGGGIFMWLIFLVVAAIVVYVVVQLVKARGPDRSAGETALDILRKRYASGEITGEEFEEKKKHLES